MATMAETDRSVLVAELLGNLPRDVTFGINKPDLHALLNAVDTVLDANRVTFNASIAALNAQWTGLSPLARAYILIVVLARRYRIGA